MQPATASSRQYSKREHTGQIEQITDDGVKIDGEWWNLSKRVRIDLSPYRVGSGVYVCADETADGQRRFITDIGHAQPRRPAPKPGEYAQPAPAFVDDMPDWPDDEPPAGAFTAVQLAAHRLECLRIAASVLVPGWTKKNVEPDRAVLLGEADALLDWLYRRED